MQRVTVAAHGCRHSMVQRSQTQAIRAGIRTGRRRLLHRGIAGASAITARRPYNAPVRSADGGSKWQAPSVFTYSTANTSQWMEPAQISRTVYVNGNHRVPYGISDS